jgi:PAS domain S-box-containing protein
MELNGSAEEIIRLQRCINDLVSLLALPVVWSGSEPSRILEILFDSLLPTLSLDFICGRLQDPISNTPIEVMRVARSCDLEPHEIREMLSDWFERDGQKRLPVTRNQFGDQRIAIFPVELELRGGTGMILIGSGREDFPGQTESLVLSAAANQASIWLNEAQFHTQRGRATDQLAREVAERTEGLAATNALPSNERNLRLILNTIPAHIYVLNTEGSVQQVNQAVMDYTGLTLEDVRQEDYRDRVIHPEDFKRVRAGRSAALSRGAPFSTEQRVLGKDGRYRWFLVRYNPMLDEQGRIDRWYVAAFDIEGRKQAETRVEQAYLRLAEAQRLSKTGSFITDLLADEHDWSEEAFRIFEFDPTTKVTVQAIRDVVHPEDLPSFDGVIARGMTGADLDLVFRIVHPRGTVKHIRGMARAMMQAGGHPLFIGALQDVTESKVAEEALDRARSELAHVARVTTLNALTASIAHEINQPLASLITNASICLRRLNADPPNLDGARETLLRTIRDGNRASDVITRLRALFTKKEFTSESLDLNDATREVIALALNDLQRNRVVLQPELAEDLPSVIGDRIQLQQVTLNLLRNASDAMVDVQDRPRQLLIRTQREADDRVCLSVRDTGCGINPQDFEKLFEPFYTTKSGGMGIGLSVSRSIIQKHQGRLWAELNDGPGATFLFSIPCAP